MAFEADCDSSTVLEARWVASTDGFPVQGERRAAFLIPSDTTSRGPRDEALRNSATPTMGSRRRMQAGGRQIRNSKFEIDPG
jgi:hypothetical protein